MGGIYLRSTHGGIGASTLGFCLARELQADLIVGRLSDEQALIAAGLPRLTWPTELWLAAVPSTKERAEAIVPLLPTTAGISVAAGQNPPAALFELVEHWSEQRFIVSEIEFPAAEEVWIAPNSQAGLDRLQDFALPATPSAIFLLKTSAQLSRYAWQEFAANIPTFEFKFQKRVFQSLDTGMGVSRRASIAQAAAQYGQWRKFSARNHA